MAHAYVQFRRRLAVHAMRQFAASLKSSGEILLLVFSNVLVGLVALVALPPAWAACQSALLALPLLCAHALAMTLPLILLRKRVLPLDVVQWQHRLPIPPRTRLAADALVAGLLVGPLALLYAVSLTVWLLQRTDWLAPGRATLGTLFSLLLTYALSVAVLALRSRMPDGRGRGRRRWQTGWRQRIAGPAPAYAVKARAPRSVLLWHRLHWLPYWRADSIVGWQQTMLLVAAAGAAGMDPGPIQRVTLCNFCNLRSDKRLPKVQPKYKLPQDFSIRFAAHLSRGAHPRILYDQIP